MKRYLVDLFDAEAIWHKLPLVVETLGILGQPQYWQPDIRKNGLNLAGNKRHGVAAGMLHPNL